MTNNKACTSMEILELLKQTPDKTHVIQLRLLGGLTATHYIYFEDNIVYDEGIDGERGEFTSADWLSDNKNRTWYLDEIID